jgi:hypothetical protein
MYIKDTTPIHVIIGICFISIPVLCMTGNWFPCFYLVTIVITLYMLLGSLRKGKIDTVFFLFPLCTFFVSWVAAFTLAQRDALLFADRAPEYTLLGFHPSFFWVALLYWLGGFIILAVGIVKLRDRWLPPDEWEAFKKIMSDMNDGAVQHHEESL